MSRRDKKLSEGSQRADREIETNREYVQDRELTDEERLDALRSNMFSKPLPDLPEIPGWHPIWLTTTNPRDSIQARRRMGYEPITEADVPEWANLSLKTGEYAGCIAVNEMIAMKLPNRLYKMYMQEAHHDAPNREEEKLSATLETIKAEAERYKAKLQIEEGTAELGHNRKAPRFEGVDP